MTVGHYLKAMPQLCNQFTRSNFRDPKRQRLYLKDIDCPDEWAKYLKDFIPETFFYLNECIEPRSGGDGAILEPNEYGQMQWGKGVAPAGDLMSSLPPDMRALNMMCYIGHEGTYTPAHREMCASLGHNIMVETSGDGEGEKAGSSVWFMTETKEREVVSEYFLSMLGHDIEVEKHFAQINAWKKAPFNVWVVEQKVGDLILIPPLAPHQVWNRGTRTMKAAWNRTTVDTLELALHEALPRARLVCREEQYKNKSIVYYTLAKYYDLLQRDTVEPKMWKYGRIKQLLEDFKRLFALYTEILVSEMFAVILPPEEDVEFLPYDSNVTCSYCRCNIFNRFLTCKTCIETGPNGEEDTYDVCMECYAMGRSCGCISNLKWVEQWEWSTLTQQHETWRNVIVQCDGSFDAQKSPQPLEIARKRYGRKPVAHVCQDQLKIRPWTDITKPSVNEQSPGASSDIEPEVDDEGRIKKKTPRKGKARKKLSPEEKKTPSCHVCFRHHPIWKQAACTTCNQAYCYGVLWRAFDMMPQEVMEDRDWSCPKCQGICSCGKCRKNPAQKPYSPKGTLLGHDTKKVADFRSVESLVDFSKTNLGWLRGENDDNPHESERMKKLKAKAEAEKAREDVINESYLGNEEPPETRNDDQNDGSIDPSLLDPSLFDAPNNDNYTSPYAPIASAVNGDGASEQQSQDWLDGHYDIDFDAFARQEANYPSRLLGPVAPVAPMHANEPPLPAASTGGQNRMMGIGYYQQGTGVDTILYDAPSADDAPESPQGAAQVNPNFALSDILPPPPEEAQKKRKHDSEDDMEFFTSKKQKLAAEAGKLKRTAVQKAGPAQKFPRRSVGKPQNYIDLGEDAVPISDADIVPAKPKAEPKPEHDGNSDEELARQAVSRLTRKPDTEKASRQKRRSARGQDLPTATTPSPKPFKRRSTWLARKEAETADDDDGDDIPATLPKKRGRPFGTKKKSFLSATVDISSDSVSVDDSYAAAEPPKKRGRPARNALARSSHTINLLSETEMENDDAGVVIDDDDSLFGDRDATKELGEGAINWRPSNEDPSIQVAEVDRASSRRRNFRIDDDEEEGEKADKPVPKRRGRPPKSDAAVDNPSGPTKLLSLKEKLASKGKSFRIVAKTPRQSYAATEKPSSAKTAPVALSLESPEPEVSYGGWSSVNGTSSTAKTSLEKAPEDSATPPVANPASGASQPVSAPAPISPSIASSVNESAQPAPVAAPPLPVKKGPTIMRRSMSPSVLSTVKKPVAPAQPVKKGPTVVRLMSPSDDSEPEGGARVASPPSESSSDDDEDEGIPAVKPSPKAVRGGGRGTFGRGMLSGRGMTAKRGRGRPSLKA
jgi:hypothetical protein